MAPESTCLTTEDRRALLEGRADASLSRRAELHLESCASCRDALEQAAQTADNATREQAHSLLRNAVIAIGSDAPSTSDPAHVPVRTGEGPGNVIGRYKLLQLIGEGGFGVVYMAEQQSPVIRKVALKIIKLGMDTRAVVARFEAERQALAMMDHPNIAKVLDAGSTDTGRPYFVMELVKGIPIAEYCDKNNLTIRHRLELFVPVCQAVQHAHQKGIIHRDLKPSNVLISLHDGKPIPKVIDFGIAKAVHQRLTEKTLFTEYKQMIGTPAYMSPEQAEFSGLDVDTRSDIYSLGVMMYELLAGVTPFDPKRLRSAAYNEIQRIIREDEPPKPSTRLSTLDSLPSVAAHRRIDPAKLAKTMRGELDWIVMKCLEKDRTRRYETADALGGDIGRYLTDQAVLAGPPSTVYRINKFVRRNRAAVVTAIAFLSLLLGGIAATSVLAYRLKRTADAERSQRQIAITEAAKQQSMKAFFISTILESADPRQRTLANTRAGPDVTLIEVVDSFARKLEHDNSLAGQPAIEAELRANIGDVYQSLASVDRALVQRQRSLSLHQELYGFDDIRTAEVMANVAMSYARLNRLTESVELLQRALSIQTKVLAPNDPTLAATLNNLAVVLSTMGRGPEARAAFAAVQKPSNEIDEATWLNNKADDLLKAREPVAAETLLRQALEIRLRTIGASHPDTAGTTNLLALALQYQDRIAEARAIYLEAIDLRRRSLPAGHPDLSNSLFGLGAMLLEQDHFSDAEPFLREAMSMLRDDDAGSALQLARIKNALGELLRSRGNLIEAERLVRDALAVRRRLAGENDPAVGTSLVSLAKVQRDAGDISAAETSVRRAIEIRNNLPPSHWHRADAIGLLGELLVLKGQFAEAEPLLLAAERRMFATPDVATSRRRECLQRMVQLYEKWQKKDDLVKWRDRLSELNRTAPPASTSTSRPIS